MRQYGLWTWCLVVACTGCQLISGLDDLEANGKLGNAIEEDGGERDAGVEPAADGGNVGSSGSGASGSGAASGASGDGASGGAGGSSGGSSGGAGGASGDGASGGGASGTSGSGAVSGASGGGASGGGASGGAGGAPAMCTPPVSGGLCDPSAQCGCSGDENCVFFERKLACVARGDAAPYHACKERDDCQAGYQCVAGACRKSCKSTSDRSCPGEGAHCYQIGENGQPISGAYVCTRDCNPAHPQLDDARFDGCGPGLKCETDGELTSCTIGNAAGTAGQKCDGLEDCAPGLFCTGRWCEPWCEMGKSDCAAGKTCTSLTPKTNVRPGLEFGFCCGSPSGRGPCDTAPQCGCPNDQACRIVDATGTTACVAAGARQAYAACETPTDCGRGFTCANNVCKALCDDAITDFCNGGACIPTRVADATNATPGFFVCRQLCSPADPYSANSEHGACGPGTECGFTTDVPEQTDCFVLSPTGTGTQGASCDDGTGTPDGARCAARHFCWDDTLRCAQYCQVGSANGCPTGLTCLPFTSKRHAGTVEIGYCE